MTKTEQLEELFEEWMQEQSKEDDESIKITKIASENITKEHFCKDGIISEEKYNSQKYKVLFIAKEPNIEQDCEDIITSQNDYFRDYYRDKVDKSGGHIRINTCKYYMWMFPEKENDNRYSVAKDFAFMNLNKRGGGEKADDEKIAAYCRKYKKYIIREIEIIDPDIIVWLGLGTFEAIQNSKEKIFNIKIGVEGEKGGKYYFVIGNKEIPLLKEYHPSYSQSNSNDIIINDEYKKKHIKDNFKMFEDELGLL